MKYKIEVFESKLRLKNKELQMEELQLEELRHCNEMIQWWSSRIEKKIKAVTKKDWSKATWEELDTIMRILKDFYHSYYSQPDAPIIQEWLGKIIHPRTFMEESGEIWTSEEIRKEINKMKLGSPVLYHFGELRHRDDVPNWYDFTCSGCHTSFETLVMSDCSFTYQYCFECLEEQILCSNPDQAMGRELGEDLPTKEEEFRIYTGKYINWPTKTKEEFEEKWKESYKWKRIVWSNVGDEDDVGDEFDDEEESDDEDCHDDFEIV